MLAAPLMLRAQATTVVSPTASVYRDIISLTDAGLVDSVVMGQWPYSRREISRLLSNARKNLDRRPALQHWADSVITRDSSLYGAGSMHTVQSVDFDAMSLSSAFRPIPPDANGENDALINPLLAYQQGRTYVDGQTLAVESLHSFTAGSHVAVSLNPRVYATAERGGHTVEAARLQSGSADFLFGNLSIGAGREYVVFGQSPNGGIVLSNNAPAFDLIRVSNDRPARIPLLSNLFGPFKGTAFLADLGPHQNFPHAKLFAYKVTALFHPRFEMGIQVADQTGGQGSPGGFTFADRVENAFPLVAELLGHSFDSLSKRHVGVDFRLNVPALRGFELYGDGAIDVADWRRWRSMFFEDGGFVTGFSFSCLIRCGGPGLRAEYHQTGIRFYTSDTFRSGYQENGFLWGDPLGPRGLASIVTLDGTVPRVGYLAATGTIQIIAGHKCASAVTGPGTTGFHFVCYEWHPGERRDRLMIDWVSNRDARTDLRASVGVEHVTNFLFVSGDNRLNGLAHLTLEIRP